MKIRRHVSRTLAVALILILLFGHVDWGKGESLATDMPAQTAGLQSTIIVTSTANSGPGTLREALLQAQNGDTITFDPVVFPPETPATIQITKGLPSLTQGNLMIDGSDAGVVLNGSMIAAEPDPEENLMCLPISSKGNIIRGLQIVDFPGTALSLQGDSQNNIIGGDRSVGAGPLGQGNLLSGNGLFGLGIWGVDASFNTVLGNCIGTDASGLNPLANLESGIIVDLGAHNNVIGPNNIIAHNIGVGIQIGDPRSLCNTITENSIHDNEWGISLGSGGNAELTPPVITDFDLDLGTVAGATYPNAIVEIFSDERNEGAVFEGRTTTDGIGAFFLDKGASLIGPRLTATVTDADGNTSPFSMPTSGTRKFTNLQEANNLLKSQFHPKQSSELEDNRLGIKDNYGRQPLLPNPGVYLDQVNNVGIKWIHVTIDWGEWDQVEVSGDYSTFDVDPTHDAAITGLADLGIEMVYSLVFWDEEIQPEENYTRFKDEEEIQRYLDYVQFIVHNFKDRIQYYELINEPRFNEGAAFHQQNIQLVDYLEVANRTVQVIRQEYPEAKIVVGANVLFYDSDYFFGILESEIMPLVDGISWHPMYGTSPEYEELREYYYNYPSIVQEIKDVASAHGFKGEYIAEELSWWTPLNPQPDHPWTYSPTVAAKYYARGIMMHLGMNVITGLNAAMAYLSTPQMVVIRNLCTTMSGAQPLSLPVEIQSEASNIRIYGFTSTNGNKLIALWTDGVAADEDTGVKVNLTLRGVTHLREVIGIDVLNSFQQPIIASTENGNLTIRNLIVRDCPLILNISEISTAPPPVISDFAPLILLSFIILVTIAAVILRKKAISSV